MLLVLATESRGRSFTMTGMFKVALSWHILSVIRTWYELLPAGLTRTEEDGGSDDPSGVVQVKLSPPEAVRRIESLRQMVPFSGVTANTGSGWTLTWTESVAVQPLAAVP